MSILNEEDSKRYLEFFGKNFEISKTMEEMSELIQALCKYQINQGNADNIIEEIADVLLMISQLSYIFGNDLVKEKIKVKLARLEERIHNEKIRSQRYRESKFYQIEDVIESLTSSSEYHKKVIMYEDIETLREKIKTILGE